MVKFARYKLTRAVFICLMLFVLSGCASVTIPNYIQDKHPYKRTFYAPYDTVHAQVVKSIEAQGWKVKEESNPALFEHGRALGDRNRAQTVIFTEMREFSFFLGSRFSRLNVFLYVKGEKNTEVEIRTVQVTSFPAKSFNNYKNDKAADQIFTHIEKGLDL